MLVEFCHTSSGASWIKCTTAEEIKKTKHTTRTEVNTKTKCTECFIICMRVAAHIQRNCVCISNNDEERNEKSSEQWKKKAVQCFSYFFFIFIRTRIWATVEEWMRWVPLASCCCSHRSLHAVGWASIWFRGRSRNRLVFVESNELFRRGEQTTMTNSAPSQHSLNRSYIHKWNRWQCKWKMVYCFRLKSA